MNAQGNDQQKDKHEDKPGGGTGQTVTIVVNTRDVAVDKGELTYEELVAIAFPQAPSGPNVLITVTYRRGQGDKPEGSLLAGQSVRVKEGMKFVVSATDKS